MSKERRERRGGKVIEEREGSGGKGVKGEERGVEEKKEKERKDWGRG